MSRGRVERSSTPAVVVMIGSSLCGSGVRIPTLAHNITEQVTIHSRSSAGLRPTAGNGITSEQAADTGWLIDEVRSFQYEALGRLF